MHTVTSSSSIASNIRRQPFEQLTPWKMREEMDVNTNLLWI